MLADAMLPPMENTRNCLSRSDFQIPLELMFPSGFLSPEYRADVIALAREDLRRIILRGATLVTSNLQFDQSTSVFGSERLTGALLDRLTHHVHILEMNSESFGERRARDSKVASIIVPTTIL